MSRFTADDVPPLKVGKTKEGRPVVINKDGSISSEQSVTIIDRRINGGRPTNIPTFFNGRKVSVEKAISIIVNSKGKDPETGRKLPGFRTIEEAVSAAIKRSGTLLTPKEDKRIRTLLGEQ